MDTPGTAYQPTDRRPMASRDRAAWQWLAQRLAAAGVPANTISIAGLACAIAAGCVLAATPFAGRWAAALFLLAAAGAQLRLAANLLDGMVALAAGRASAVGELYNELPDRASDFAILVGAGHAVGGWPAMGYTAASAAIATAYVRAVGKSMGVPGLFQGPMAKPQRMLVVTVACVAAAVVPRPRGVMAVALAVIVVGCVVTGWRRVARIASHLRGGAA